jgi:hypothetical protein
VQPPRSLADGRALLRPHLLPRSVRAACSSTTSTTTGRAHLLSRPSSPSTSFPAC